MTYADMGGGRPMATLDGAGGTFLGDVTNTAYLLGMFGVIDRVSPVLLNLFFPMQQNFETAEVYWDQIERARNLAPLVTPTVAGKPERSRGYSTRGISPPYFKPKHVVEPLRALRRRVGERLLGAISPAERFQLSIMDNLFLEDQSITRREEWMATQLLLTGSMTMTGDDWPNSFTVDMGRNSAHTVALTTTARWGETGVDALGNLNDWAATVQKNSGFHPGVVVMDPKAAKLFRQSPGVLTVMQSFRQQSGNIDLAGVVTGGAPGQEAKLIADIGEFQIWQYQQLWTDSSGTVQQFMPDNTVIMGNPAGLGGTRTYGAILDAESLVPLPRFPKAWLERDPSSWITMIQSAPCPVLGWPHASFCATVR